MLGDKSCASGIPDLTAVGTDLLFEEYQQVNAHLRANISQFVNWFSFFLVFSLAAAAALAFSAAMFPALRGLELLVGAKVVFLLMHVLAFVGIFNFRRYIVAAHCRLEAIVRELGEEGASPIPVRFCQWMTDLMAAGFVVSYFTWFALLFWG